MKTMQAQLTVTMPIFPKFHQQAEKFSKNQSSPQKYKEVYLNTLAVLVVDFYLKCLEIETDLEKSESWNPLIQTLMNVADLVIRNLGKIECRIILPGEDICYIPEEVWEDRIGFIGVQINQELTEANLVGFIEGINTERVEIEEMRSLSYFLDYIDYLSNYPNIIKNLPSGWQSRQLMTIARNNPALLKREKQFNFETTTENSVNVLLTLIPVINQNKIGIDIKIYPSQSAHLPEGLEVALVDQNQHPFLQTLPGLSPSFDIDFTGEYGDNFCLILTQGEITFTEQFYL